MKYTIKETTTLLNAVMQMYSGVSRQKAKQILSYTDFSVNGQTIEKQATKILNLGDVLESGSTRKEISGIQLPTKQNPISIVYEDKQLLIALKPAGIITSKDRNQPNAKSFHKFLETYLTKRDEKAHRIWSVHRLDKEVEGLVLFAKSEEIQLKIKDTWDHVVKKYLALTEAKPAEESGIIEDWLKDSYKQKVEAFDKEVENSRFAKTEYRFIETRGKYHLLEITLHTGRKNQIRVHLSGLGCPIAGDYKYGASAEFKRQIRLAAYHLNFTHPTTGKNLSFEYQPTKKFFKPSNFDEKYDML